MQALEKPFANSTIGDKAKPPKPLHSCEKRLPLSGKHMLEEDSISTPTEVVEVIPKGPGGHQVTDGLHSQPSPLASDVALVDPSSIWTLALGARQQVSGEVKPPGNILFAFDRK